MPAELCFEAVDLLDHGLVPVGLLHPLGEQGPELLPELAVLVLPQGIRLQQPLLQLPGLLQAVLVQVLVSSQLAPGLVDVVCQLF